MYLNPSQGLRNRGNSSTWLLRIIWQWCVLRLFLMLRTFLWSKKQWLFSVNKQVRPSVFSPSLPVAPFFNPLLFFKFSNTCSASGQICRPALTPNTNLEHTHTQQQQEARNTSSAFLKVKTSWNIPLVPSGKGFLPLLKFICRKSHCISSVWYFYTTRLFSFILWKQTLFLFLFLLGSCSMSEPDIYGQPWVNIEMLISVRVKEWLLDEHQNILLFAVFSGFIHCWLAKI